jgi:hypothetical protein
VFNTKYGAVRILLWSGWRLTITPQILILVNTNTNISCWVLPLSKQSSVLCSEQPVLSICGHTFRQLVLQQVLHF